MWQTETTYYPGFALNITKTGNKQVNANRCSYTSTPEVSSLCASWDKTDQDHYIRISPSISNILTKASKTTLREYHIMGTSIYCSTKVSMVFPDFIAQLSALDFSASSCFRAVRGKGWLTTINLENILHKLLQTVMISTINS